MKGPESAVAVLCCIASVSYTHLPMDAEIRKRPNGASVVEKDVPWDMPIEQRIYDEMCIRDRFIYCRYPSTPNYLCRDSK